MCIPTILRRPCLRSKHGGKAENVVPNNNETGSALRKAVLWRKGRFGVNSEAGAQSDFPCAEPWLLRMGPGVPCVSRLPSRVKLAGRRADRNGAGIQPCCRGSGPRVAALSALLGKSNQTSKRKFQGSTIG